MRRVFRVIRKVTGKMLNGWHRYRYAINKYHSVEKAQKYIHFSALAKQNGVIPFRWDRIASEYVDDFYADTGIPAEEKEWYYSRGIATFKVQWQGLTKENYNDYISDFDFYHRKNYQNKAFQEWFEHKLNTYFLLAPFKQYLPRHYYYLHSGRIYPLDLGKKCNNEVADIITLIQEQPIAAKACVGGHGKGFYKLSYSNNRFYVNNEPTEEPALMKMIGNLDSYIITEYGVPHSELRKLCGENAFAVIRAVSVYDETAGGQITGLMIRLGSKDAGIVTDYDGTIYCGIDLNDGHFFTPVYRTGDNDGIIRRRDILNHPDTNQRLEGFVLPNFKELCSLVKAISEYLPVTPYLVMDIIPTENGFKVLEINSHGQVRNVEPFYPFRKNEYNLKVFDTIER